MQGRREHELKNVPKWKKFWMKIHKRDCPDTKEKLDWERKFLHRLMLKFVYTLEEIPDTGNFDIMKDTIDLYI